jgi:hypothetical protein
MVDKSKPLSVFGHRLRPGGGFSKGWSYLGITTIENFSSNLILPEPWTASSPFTSDEVHNAAKRARGHAIGSLRWDIFKQFPFCVFCETNMTHVIVWQEDKGNRQIHVDAAGLYNDQWVMFTIDHHIPRSNGGKNTRDNLQPACASCNNKKGNSHREPTVDIFSRKISS